tara:strand:+ start:36 stop:704 length:669 start_codon:yes stop_codon:yes gene_type:complete
MASKIKVDQIEGQSGSSIEVPTGHTLKVADHGNNKIIATNSSGILSGVNIGSAGQSLVVNSSANGFEFNAISSDFARQIKYVQQSSSISFSSTTHSDTGLSLTFDNNLKSTNSLVKITFNSAWGTTNNPDNIRIKYRDGSGNDITNVIGNPDTHVGGSENTSSSYCQIISGVCFATVSSTTPIAYRPYVRREGANGHTGYFGRDHDNSHSYPILFMIEEYAI